MLTAYTNVWTKIATALHGTSGLWSYGIMNEPHDIATSGLSTWQTASQNAVEAIRAVDQTAHINVGGYAYQGIQNWSTINGSTPWLTETIPTGQIGAGSARNTDNLIIWEGHMYYDYDGTYSDDSGSSTFSSLNSNAVSAGYAPYTNSTGNVPALDISSQTGNIQLFQSYMNASTDWTLVTQGSNTVTVPYASVGNPGNSLQVINTATSDEGSVRQTLQTTATSFSFDFYIPTGTTVSSSSNFAICHLWNQNYYSGSGILDVAEIRVLGSGSGYIFCVTDPNGSYATTNGTTVCSLGTWNNIKITIGSTSASIYVNGSGTANATQSLTNTSSTIGGVALGKFYGTSFTGTDYFDNALATVSGTYDAPPNGGLLSTVLNSTSPTLGLIEFLI